MLSVEAGSEPCADLGVSRFLRIGLHTRLSRIHLMESFEMKFIYLYLIGICSIVLGAETSVQNKNFFPSVHELKTWAQQPNESVAIHAIQHDDSRAFLLFRDFCFGGSCMDLHFYVESKDGLHLIFEHETVPRQLKHSVVNGVLQIKTSLNEDFLTYNLDNLKHYRSLESSPVLREITVSALNSNDVAVIGELGYPVGTFHEIEGEFAMFNAHGRAGQGGRIYLKILSVDGKSLSEPLGLPYFKSVSLQDYLLPDGTDIFPVHPNTHKLQGKKITCTIYEDIFFVDNGGDIEIFESSNESRGKGFEEPWFETALGIVEIKGSAEQPSGDDSVPGMPGIPSNIVDEIVEEMLDIEK